MKWRDWVYRWSGILAALLVAGILGYAFLPASVTLLKDDYFVLAERAFLQSETDWFVHLISLNQRRFTWVGDSALFRPFFFAYHWVIDCAFRSDRGWIAVAGLLPVWLASFSIFILGRKWVHPVYALVGAMLWAVYKGDSQLATWEHVSPYCFGLAGFFLGMACVREHPRWALLAWVLGGMSHEFVIVALFGFVVFDKCRSWGERDASDAVMNTAMWSVSVLIGVAALNFMFLGHLTQGSGSAGFSLTQLIHSLVFVSQSVASFIGTSIGYLIPFGGPLLRLGIVRDHPVIISCLFLIFSLSALRNSGVRPFQKEGWLLLCFGFALAGGLGATRFLMRGYVEGYYFQIFAAFAIVWILYVSKKGLADCKSIPKWIGVSVFFTFVVFQARVYSIDGSLKRQRIWYRQDIANAATDFYRQNKFRSLGLCYQDLRFEPNTDSDPNINYELIKELDVLLYRISCDHFSRTHSKLMPFSILIQGEKIQVGLVEPPAELIGSQELKATDVEPEVQPMSNVGVLNIWQAGMVPLKQESLLSPMRLYGPSHFYSNQNTVEIVMKQSEPFPAMLGFGVQIGFLNSYKDSVQVIFHQNDVRLAYRGKWNHGVINSQPNDFKIWITAERNRCTVFVDKKRVVDLLDCEFPRGRIGYFDIENNTPHEELVSISIGNLKLDDGTNRPIFIESPLQRSTTYPLPKRGEVKAPVR